MECELVDEQMSGEGLGSSLDRRLDSPTDRQTNKHAV